MSADLRPHDLQMVVQRSPGQLLGRCTSGRHAEGPSVAMLRALVRAHDVACLDGVVPRQR